MRGQSITYMEVDGIPQDIEDPDDDSLHHIWCSCKGDNISLCGVDLEDATVAENVIPEDECVVCKDLDETHDNYCPMAQD